MIITTVRAYLQYEVVTSIRVMHQMQSKFVALRLCNINSLQTAEALNYSKNMVASILDDTNTTRLEEWAVSEGDWENLRHTITLSARSPNVTTKERMTFGMSIKDMLIECSFNFEPCTAADFEWHFDEMYGSCYRFNYFRGVNKTSPPVKVSTKNGKEHGLYMELLVVDPSASIFSFSTNLGLRMTVHNQSVAPLFDEGFDVQVGTHANIAINRVFTKKQPRPYSDCVLNIDSHQSTLTRFFVANSYTYNQVECFNYCYQRELVSKCDCYDAGFPRMTFNRTPCYSWADLRCLNNVWFHFFLNYTTLNCSQECPVECSSVSYPVSLSSSEFPTSSYMRVLLRKSKHLQSLVEGVASETEKLMIVRKNVAAISAFYELPSYTYIEEKPKYELFDLVSGVGGLLGVN
jgi:hypothetical protein